MTLIDLIEAAAARLDAAGLPVVDHFRGTLPVPGAALARGWRAVVEGLAPGVTHFALHCTVPGEIEAIAPGGHPAWRTNEHALLASGAPAGSATLPRLPAATMRSFVTTTTPSATGAAPVPSISRAAWSTTVPVPRTG